MIETFNHTVLPIIIQIVVLNKTIILQLTLNLILNWTNASFKCL